MAVAEQASERNLEIPVYGSYLRVGARGFNEEFERELETTESLQAERILSEPVLKSVRSILSRTGPRSSKTCRPSHRRLPRGESRSPSKSTRGQ